MIHMDLIDYTVGQIRSNTRQHHWFSNQELGRAVFEKLKTVLPEAQLYERKTDSFIICSARAKRRLRAEMEDHRKRLLRELAENEEFLKKLKYGNEEPTRR